MQYALGVAAVAGWSMPVCASQRNQMLPHCPVNTSQTTVLVEIQGHRLFLSHSALEKCERVILKLYSKQFRSLARGETSTSRSSSTSNNSKNRSVSDPPVLRTHTQKSMTCETDCVVYLLNTSCHANTGPCRNTFHCSFAHQYMKDANNKDGW